MKRTGRIVATATALALLAGTASFAKPAAPILATDLLVRRDTPALSYRWTAAPQMALEPKLFRALQADGQKWLRSEDAAANANKADAAKNDFPFRGNTWSQLWASQAETPHLLAFSSQVYSYAGGAHGNLGFKTALFDRKAQKQIAFADLFTDPKAAYAALTPDWCKALDAERAKRRGTEKLDSFSDCIALKDNPIVPVGDDSIRSLLVLVAPYNAGPWSEGTYEITLDAASIEKLLKPQYRAAFAKP